MISVNPTSEFFSVNKDPIRILIKTDDIALALLMELNLLALHGLPITLILHGLKCLNTTLLHSRLVFILLSLFVHRILASTRVF